MDTLPSHPQSPLRSFDSSYHRRLFSPCKSPKESPRSTIQSSIPISPSSTFSPPYLSPSISRSSQFDRFVPSRVTSNLESAFQLASSTQLESAETEDSSNIGKTSTYQDLLKSELLGETSSVFSYSTRSPGCSALRNLSKTSIPSDDIFATSPISEKTKRIIGQKRQLQRKVPKAPFKILDAPALQDDYYLNLLDWSNQNILAVGLGSSVYLWSAFTGKVTKLCDVGNDCVTSLGWNPEGSRIAIGRTGGLVEEWDSSTCQKYSEWSGHTGRVGVVNWGNNTLASGGRDRSILLHDPRCSGSHIMRLEAHTQEVCGMKWSFDDRQLASGGNDNKLYIWDARSNRPTFEFSDHNAAVKAIAWSPHHNALLMTGGGTADQTIRFWNTTVGSCVGSHHTGSQVCNLMWSRTLKSEIVSTHGYSLNQIIIWKYPTMEKVATLTGHTSRVLYLSMSPDGQTIVTGAGDETLRFWSVFPSSQSKSMSRPGSGLLFPLGPEIR